MDSVDVDPGDLGTTVERAQQAANEDDLALISSLDGLSELSEFQIEDADRDSFVTDDDNIVGLENSESSGRSRSGESRKGVGASVWRSAGE